MNYEQLIEYVLKNPRNYPGAHNKPAPRSIPGAKPLETKAQLMIMWRAMSEYINDRLTNG